MPAGPSDGGPPRVLEIVATSDLGSADPGQVGLAYNDVTVLTVRYRLDDVAHTPLSGQDIHFAIFDDPRGSTLSSDRARTDGSGLASVSLTAGSEETLFRVRASVDGALVDYRIGTSNVGFVGIDVSLSWSSAAPLMTLRALVYLDKTCAEMPEDPTVAPAFNEISGPGPMTTLEFRALLSRSYAVLGRAEDTAGHLLASRCIDLGRAQLPAGVVTQITLPLAAVSPRLDGHYQLTTALTWPMTERSARTLPYSRWTRCPFGPAEALLDGIVASLSGTLATSINAKRGALGSTGCRAGTVAATASLDAQLDTAMTTPGSVGAELTTIAAEVDQLFASAQLHSELDVVGSAGRHRLTTLGLSINATTSLTPEVDLAALGLPVVETWPVSLSLENGSLSIGAHGFTVGLPERLGEAFDTLSLAPRLSSVMDPEPHDLATQVVKGTLFGAKTDCAAVEALICAATGASGCVGPTATACAAATTGWGTILDATFQSPGGLDLVLSGVAATIDTDGDLIVDTLKPASWVTSLDPSGNTPSPFSALREP